MASLKYRCLEIAPVTEMLPVAASQYFYHNGVNAVYLDGSGHVTLALTATATLYGIAVPPKGRGAGASDNYWLSSSTAGKDEIPVIPFQSNPGAKFLCPADATVATSNIGNACDLIAVNDGTATQVDIGTSSTDVFIIHDLGNTIAGGGATDVIIKANPAKLQADT